MCTSSWEVNLQEAGPITSPSPEALGSGGLQHAEPSPQGEVRYMPCIFHHLEKGSPLDRGLGVLTPSTLRNAAANHLPRDSEGGQFSVLPRAREGSAIPRPGGPVLGPVTHPLSSIRGS